MNELGHHPEFVRTIQILKPLLRRHPPLSVMPTSELCDWMSYYWNRGTMSYVICNGDACGVCLIRLFRVLEQWLDSNAHDPCGRFCLIELLISSDPVTTGQLCSALVDRWGNQEVVMWDRSERTEKGAPRMFRWDKFMKLARKISYGVIENA